MNRAARVLACALAALGACRPADAPRPGSPALSAPLDLAATIRRVRLGFHSAAGGHEAVGPAFRARVDAAGSLALSPEDPGRPASSALLLAPPRIGRGGRVFAAPGPARVGRDGGISRARGDAVERLASGERGLEIAWTFPGPPPGDGPITVGIPATGLPFRVATASGLHFGAAGTSGVRCGHASWIDAAGRRTPVAARWTGAEIAYEVPEVVVEAAAYPAVLDPLISPEAEVDVAIVGGAPEAQLEPAVATDGTVFLVAWVDRRTREEEWVVATRVALDGTVLDPVGIRVAASPGQRAAPAVAAGAGAFLVAWQQSGAAGTQLVATPVGADGSLMAGPATVVDEVYGDPGRTTAAFDGEAFRVAWSSFDDDPDPRFGDCPLRLATLDAAAAPVGRASLGTSTCGGRSRPALACAGEDCLVVYARSGYLMRGLYDRAGAPRDPAGLRTAFLGGSEPAAIFDGAEYVVAFQRPGAVTGTFDVVGARMSAAGNVVDTTPFPVAEGGTGAWPALAFDGTAVLAAWEARSPQGTDLRALRMAPDGTPLDAVTIPVSEAPGAQIAPALAASPAGALVAFADTRSDPAGDVYAARILPGGAVADPEGLLLSRSAGREARPAVAFDGTRWLVAFEDARASGHATGIFGLRLAADGTPLDAAPFAIADGTNAELRPAAAGCAGGFFVAWEDYRSGSADVFVARVPGEGAASSPPAHAVATGAYAQGPPAIACGSAGALVAWHDAGAYPARPRAMVAARLGPDGAPLDPAGLVLSEQTAGAPPSVAATAQGFAVAWAASDAGGHGLVLASPIAPDGTRGPVATVCDAPAATSDLALAVDAGGLQVVFVDQRTAPGHLRTARLSAGGAVLDPCGVEIPGTSGAAAPAMAFDGARHLVAFELPESGGLRGVQLAPGGGALGAFDLAAGADAQRTPRVACDGRGTCLVASERWDPVAGNGRARVRLVSSDPPAARCAAGAECASGFCVDGVCCSSECGGGDASDCLACSVAAGAPADGVCAPVAPGGLCRAGTACDAAERCDGADAACPEDALAPDGDFCNDGDACTRADACRGGACAGADPVQCAQETCYASACDPATGSCRTTRAPLGTPCDDGDPCTDGDACDPDRSYWEICKGTGKTCPASPCHVGACNPYTGACGEVAVADGISCSDGSACTVEDRCLAGACVAGPAVRCPPPDACHHAGLCDRATGACAFAPSADGTPCDDRDACTRASACSAGTCVGSAPVACPGADACNDAGACDPGSGACGPPQPKMDGTACDDGNACTGADACVGGRCAGADPTVCAPAGPCREAGLCDPATGACSSPWRPLGTPCDDGDPCTTGDACAGGECRPGAAPTCPPLETPCVLATCDASSGACGVAPAADGTACPGGQCSAGSCVAAEPSGGCATGGGAPALALLALALAGVGGRGPRRRRGRPAQAR
jgi:hypothetical protein